MGGGLGDETGSASALPELVNDERFTGNVSNLHPYTCIVAWAEADLMKRKEQRRQHGHNDRPRLSCCGRAPHSKRFSRGLPIGFQSEAPIIIGEPTYDMRFRMRFDKREQPPLRSSSFLFRSELPCGTVNLSSAFSIIKSSCRELSFTNPLNELSKTSDSLVGVRWESRLTFEIQ